MRGLALYLDAEAVKEITGITKVTLERWATGREARAAAEAQAGRPRRTNGAPAPRLNLLVEFISLTLTGT